MRASILGSDALTAEQKGHALERIDDRDTVLAIVRESVSAEPLDD